MKKMFLIAAILAVAVTGVSVAYAGDAGPNGAPHKIPASNNANTLTSPGVNTNTETPAPAASNRQSPAASTAQRINPTISWTFAPWAGRLYPTGH